tara:strand:- start:261 stop:494 length:234 start_codon:yes stop_codon:yes gene_type:complete
MTNEEKNLKIKELATILKPKHSDIKINIDEADNKGNIAISFYWNRISQQNWKDAKTFRCHISEYKNILKNNIIPYFE